MSDVCPGCGVRFGPFDGPTHRYIGANAACWALYAAVLVRGEPASALLRESFVVRPSRPDERMAAADLALLLPDAYAAQHHGELSRVAIQSVGVHLLTLHGVIRRGVAPKNANWPRTRALRRADALEWLDPPPLGAALSVRHLFPGGEVGAPCSVADYVASVNDAWEAVHSATLAAWYDTLVLPD